MIVETRTACIDQSLDVGDDVQNKLAIQSIAQARDIPYLVHFTRAANLPSIMEHGLVPRDQAIAYGYDPRINDKRRLDGRIGATSLSIGFPNECMFYKYRMQNPFEHWVVLIIDPSILWRKRCIFARRNAAHHTIRDLPAQTLAAATELAGMFDEIDGIASRREQRLRNYDPTDVQAEVMVFDTIEPEHIGHAVFNHTIAFKRYQSTLQRCEPVHVWQCENVYSKRCYAR